MSKPRTPPAYPKKPHKTGQARIRLAGVDVYLGVHGSPESYTAYERAIAEWRSSGAVRRGFARTVKELLGEWYQHMDSDESGYSGQERINFRRSLLPVHNLYGPRPLRDFDALALQAVRRKMVEDGAKSRKMVNGRVGRIKRVWRWGVSQKLVPVECWQELESVLNLGPGEGGAVDYDDVPPVADADVEWTIPELTHILAAAVTVQFWTGARPGEVLQLRPCDIIRTGQVEIERGLTVDASKVWVTVLRPMRVPRPRQANPAAPERLGHKTGKRGHTRVILYGPQAQAALLPLLDGRPENAWIFNPDEARRAHHTARAQARKTPYYPSSKKPKPTRPLRNVRYSVNSYGHAILRAADRANAKAIAAARQAGREVAEGVRLVAHWHPHMLRHAAGTRITDEFGPELARIILGQRTLSATRIYARDNIERAAAVVADAG